MKHLILGLLISLGINCYAQVPNPKSTWILNKVFNIKSCLTGHAELKTTFRRG